jgi:hypothetical protein
MRRQYASEQGFLDAVNEIISDVCEEYETEDEDEGDKERRFSAVCEAAEIGIDMTEADIRAAIILAPRYRSVR